MDIRQTSSIAEVISSCRSSCNFGRALAAHFLTKTDGSLAHFPTATRTRGEITCRRIPAMARRAHALTNGLGSPKSFWKQLIDNKASLGRLDNTNAIQVNHLKKLHNFTSLHQTEQKRISMNTTKEHTFQHNARGTSKPASLLPRTEMQHS